MNRRHRYCIALTLIVASTFFSSTVHAETTYHIVAGGDVMLGRRMEKNIHKYGKGDYRYPWQYIAHIFQSADIAFINHEAAMSTRGKDSGKRYSFRVDPRNLIGIEYAGIDVASLANNHINDWGTDALCDTVENLNSINAGPVGAGCNRKQAYAPVTKTLPDGTRVSFFAITPFTQYLIPTKKKPGISLFDSDWLIEKIRDMKEKNLTDIIIVSSHTGTEHVRKSNKIQQTLYRKLIDNGADLILGHHPHVPQEIEKYNDKYIIYSLGNLIFDMHDRLPGTKDQFIADIVVYNGSIINVFSIPITMNQYFQPILTDKKPTLF
jgi:poly-gamma-glutamate synthesis protein (capsule biosynthesis protein)